VHRYKEIHDLDFAKYLAGAITNEVVSDPPSNEQGREFLERNRALIEQELFKLSEDMEIRRVLTDPIPSFQWPLSFMLLALRDSAASLGRGSIPNPQKFLPLASPYSNCSRSRSVCLLS
jgi:hypothetical protein